LIRYLYDWLMRLAGHDRAPYALFGVAFVESSFFPIPPDVMLVPMILAKRDKAWVYASICTIASVLGGMVGYAIGYVFFDRIGEPIVRFYGYGERFADATQLLNEWGVWVLIAKGMSPFPYKVLTIAAGASKMDLVLFILASIVSRAMRFYVVAALLFWFGERTRDFIERRFNAVTTFLILLVGAFIAIKYMF
jgi:membrane protein YqaA with SNARE-associated domain